MRAAKRDRANIDAAERRDLSERVAKSPHPERRALAVRRLAVAEAQLVAGTDMRVKRLVVADRPARRREVRRRMRRARVARERASAQQFEELARARALPPGRARERDAEAALVAVALRRLDGDGERHGHGLLGAFDTDGLLSNGSGSLPDAFCGQEFKRRERPSTTS